MYEIIKQVREVRGVTIDTWKAEMVNANILEVEVGTTGFQGGDSGHGGRTFLSIRDLGGTDIDVKIKR